MVPTAKVNTIVVALYIISSVAFWWAIDRRHTIFWQDEAQGINITHSDSGIVSLDDPLMLRFEHTGKLVVTGRGYISAGRIAGYVSPLGTEMGFFALPIGDVFDVCKPCRHATLLYCPEDVDDCNCLFEKLPVPLAANYLGPTTYTDTLAVIAGSTWRFRINDNEPHNNSQSFHLSVSYLE